MVIQVFYCYYNVLNIDPDFNTYKYSTLVRVVQIFQKLYCSCKF